MQQYQFEADAAEVYRFLLNAPKWVMPHYEPTRLIHAEEMTCCLHCLMAGEATPDALYRISFLNGSLGRGSLQACLENDRRWLANGIDAGYIDLVQEQRGRCRAVLYVNPDLRAWRATEDDRYSYVVGRQLMGKLWRELIAAWEERIAASQGARATNVRPPKRVKRGGVRHHGIRDNTRMALTELIAYRANQIQATGQTPVWTYACHLCKIDSATVRRYLPELRERWDDLTYQPSSASRIPKAPIKADAARRPAKPQK